MSPERTGPHPPLGHPRVHLRATESTNLTARALAERGAPHGTVVTATEQTAGRGRQGRRWVGPPGQSLLLSVVIREGGRLLPLAGGIAVAEVAGPAALVKWPNDVLLDGRKVAGILVEGRPQAGWAVVGIGVNVAVEPARLPGELADRAGTLGRSASELEAVLAELLPALDRWIAADESTLLAAVRRRDALDGREVTWADGCGTGAGIDAEGRLLVRLGDGATRALEAGEVHLAADP